jgi:M6 family metalloprotease-like protein
MKEFLNGTKVFRRAAFFVLTALVAIVSAANPAAAVMAAPDLHERVQSDGSVAQYYLRGDEFFSYKVTPAGDLLAEGEDGDLHLARWASAEEANAGKPMIMALRAKPGPASRLAPPDRAKAGVLKSPVPSHIAERTRAARNFRDAPDRARFIPEDAPAAFAPGAESANSSERRVLLIYVNFPQDDKINSIKGPSDKWLSDLMFDESKMGTVAHFYKTVTGGKARITPAFDTGAAPGVLSADVSGNHANWGQVTLYNGESFWNCLKEALQKTDGDINYASFDANGDKEITPDELSICFIIHGYEASKGIGGPSDATHPSVYAHQGQFCKNDGGTWKPDYKELDSVKLSSYACFGAFHSKTDPPDFLTMGVIAHELGHLAFDFPDLYDVSYKSDGIGPWSLMAGGSWGARPGERGGQTPAALDAYCLSMLGLPAKAPDQDGAYKLSNVWEYAKITNSADTNQYHLVQGRGDVGYDRGLAARFGRGKWIENSMDGALILHVDDNLSGSNGEAGAHLRVAVMDASGTQRAEKNLASDSDGLFSPSNYSTTSFTDSTNPSSKIFKENASTTRTLPSGASITNIASSPAGLSTDNGNVEVTFGYVRKDDSPSESAGGGGCAAGPGGLTALAFCAGFIAAKKRRG